eukprot:13410660-Alexandrium_andersonii.AAC.1
MANRSHAAARADGCQTSSATRPAAAALRRPVVWPTAGAPARPALRRILQRWAASRQRIRVGRTIERA